MGSLRSLPGRPWSLVPSGGRVASGGEGGRLEALDGRGSPHGSDSARTDEGADRGDLVTAQKVGDCPWCDEFADPTHVYGPEDRNAHGAWTVQCTECGASGPEISGTIYSKSARHEAVKQWNRLAFRKVGPSVG